MQRFTTNLLAALGAAVLTVGLTAGGTYEISSYTIDAGGGTSMQDEWILDGTIGQPDATVTISGDEWSLTGGFWPGSEVLPDPCPADNNGDGSVDVTDLLAVLGAWGPCPPPCPQDTDDSGAVDVTDLLLVLGAWGNCP